MKVRGKVYLVLDEVQEIDGWERVVNAYRALERIRDNYPKCVLSPDDASFGTRNGIGHIPIWQLLASDAEAAPALPRERA